MDPETNDGPGEAPAPVPFFVAAVGASAGGLEALADFLEGVTPGAGIVYVVIQHLSPDFKSMMTELLPRHTKLRVMELEHDTVPAPDRVYLLPAKKAVRLEHGRFRLSERQPSSPPRPIDRVTCRAPGRSCCGHHSEWHGY